MTWLIDAGLFALLFFLLVFVHELGHFLMAKWVGISVERFSIGMGPTVLSFTRGETEYKWGLLPLGGYVKMLGDDPTKEFSEEEKQKGFLAKSPPQKLLVVFGGPLFNLILPIFLFSIMAAIGIPKLEPVVGFMEEDFPALQSGLKSGDRVLTIDGERIKNWNQIESKVEKSEGKTLQLEVERRDLATNELKKLQISVTPKIADTKNKFGEDVKAPRLGISPEYVTPQIFIENPKSVAALAGLQNFDRVLRVNGIETMTGEQFWTVLNDLKPGPVNLDIERGVEKITKTLDIPAGQRPVAERLGIFPTDLVVGMVDPKSPAAQAGLQPNDRLIAIQGQELKEFEQLAKIIRASEGKPVEVKWSRAGEIMTATMSPEKTTLHDPVLGKDNPLAAQAFYRIGVGTAKKHDKVLSIERTSNPIKCIERGLSDSWLMGKTTVIALYRLFTGQLSLKMLGSPIMIYKVAGASYRAPGGGYMGWISFLTNLGLLSITLGLFNLLPVPVLDGGHATFFFIEWIRGKPVGVRVMEIATQVGLFLLISLFAVVLFNDFHRYGFFDSLLKIFR